LNGDKTEWLETDNNPEDPEAGTRSLPFNRTLWIEKDDFMENPPPKYFRLSPGGLARLKSAYIIQCDEVIKDDQGEVVELKCSYFPDSKSGEDTSGLKPKSTIHWLSAERAIPAEIRLYDRLFTVEDPANDDRDLLELINPESLVTVRQAMVEPALQETKVGDKYQFMRLGYFTTDPDSRPDQLVFNRTVSLKDNWKKVSSAG